MSFFSAGSGGTALHVDSPLLMHRFPSSALEMKTWIMVASPLSATAIL